MGSTWDGGWCEMTCDCCNVLMLSSFKTTSRMTAFSSWAFDWASSIALVNSPLTFSSSAANRAFSLLK